MRLKQLESLRPLNTFGIDARAKWLAEIESIEDYRALIADRRFALERRMVLGGGSNILFTRDFDGLVIKNSLPGIELLREDAQHVWVRAAAGEVWHALVMHCVDRGWGGLENLALIPGQVGAAPMQNIGAYGVEMAETCESVEAADAATGDPIVFSNADCGFGYRDSVFKHRYRDRFLITAVTFRLSKTPSFQIDYGDLRKTLDEMGVSTLSIRAVSEAVIRIRSSKLPDPRVLGNAGSFFKNPVLQRERFDRIVLQHGDLPHYPQPDGSVKVPAAWLIERCGWKGRTLGRAGVHEQHALVLVNRGGATGEEILRLAAQIHRSVRDDFWIDLTPEVNLV